MPGPFGIRSFMRSLRWLCTFGWKYAGAGAMALCLLWLAWTNLAPRKPEIGPVRREMADKLIPVIVTDLQKARKGIRSAALLHLGGDPSDYVTNQLRAGILNAGIFDLYDLAFTERVRNLLGLRLTPCVAADAALRRGEGLGVEWVIFGKINAFEYGKAGSRLDLELHLMDVYDRKVVFRKHYTEGTPVGTLTPAVIEQEVSRFGWGQRIVGWALAVLLLPLFTIAFIRAMVRKESNLANGFTLGIYTVIDALLAYLMMGARLTTWLAGLLYLAIVVAAFIYNMSVMSFAVRLES